MQITPSEWLLDYVRSNTGFPSDSTISYNTIEEGANQIALIENSGDMTATTFVDGSGIAEVPFMIVIRVNQEEIDELALQTMWDDVISWFANNSAEDQQINDYSKVMRFAVLSNLTIQSRDDNGNAEYMAQFRWQYSYTE